MVTKNVRVKTLYASPSIEPFKVMTAKTFFKLIPPITVTFAPTLEDSLTLRYR
ncbi:hypothetical protein [Dendronalium sp. ChiSLP03b]|uniref:hypothetical protein n=1 Tax=Dendronalium sp. ChiSLP03b TaxID=3075381 RepID=UPI00391C2D74